MTYEEAFQAYLVLKEKLMRMYIDTGDEKAFLEYLVMKSPEKRKFPR